ncbi:hypothetical protein ALC53_04317 [Atta colombica]|uniref:Uncharacterized protein n=1 Tax=Atta colombica TaxID=520822 RepID=A0A151I4V1_9HYME|nr:hypothetical protein ALC53_04317 [Atta colombica]
MSRGLRKAICYRAMQSGNGNLQYFHSGNGNTNKVRRWHGYECKLCGECVRKNNRRIIGEYADNQIRACDFTRAGNKEAEKLEAEVGEIKREVWEQLHRKRNEEWAKQMGEAEVRARGLTEKGRELEIKDLSSQRERVRERTGSNRREESEQEEARSEVSGRGKYSTYTRIVTNSGREERRLNFVIKGINVEEELKDREKGQRRREVWVKEWVEEKLEVECNIVAARESVYVVEGEEKKKRKS